MDNFEEFVSGIDYTLNTKSKRHIAGGILLSIASLFGSLAFTVMSMKEDKR